MKMTKQSPVERCMRGNRVQEIKCLSCSCGPRFGGRHKFKQHENGGLLEKFPHGVSIQLTLTRTNENMNRTNLHVCSGSDKDAGREQPPTPAPGQQAAREEHPCHARTYGSSFVPGEVEKEVYAWWERRGSFAPRGEGEKFTMVIPPPNVTGQLHIGHALTVTVQDTLVRWRRMQGFDTQWIPGVDHAGIATQSAVERRLAKTQGVTRHDLGRERFLQEVWKWYEDYNGRIDNQLRRMGASLDWKQKVFTMDDTRYRAATRAFVQLHEKGLVYRSERLVNWCPHLRTVISDLEVDSEEITKPTRLSLPGQDKAVEFGVMHDFAYPVQGGGELVVSTTRLETMLGDAAVAIHPEDPRYKHLHGGRVEHPMFPGRTLPIVLDADLVDPEQGTGAVKITPAHDENDFACAQRHGLEIVNMLNDDATLNATCGPTWEGMGRFEAREKLVKALDEAGLYRGKRANPMRLARCSRSGDVIEPLLKPQWFVNCDRMAERALKAVETGDLQLEPAWHAKTWREFLSKIHDWCVSRQLWWGHRIPAYRIAGDVEDRWWVAETHEEAAALASRDTGRALETLELEQDPDVLDTWFSSGLFAMSAQGWPDKEMSALDRYPLSLMETGADILFFWVARMVFLSSELRPDGGLPFPRVLLHPMIRDRQGRKMSKSLGNVIDPLHVMDGVSLETLQDGVRQGNLAASEVKRALKSLEQEFPQGIPACGTDAQRLALASYMNASSAINLDIGRVEVWKHFCNKLWNAQRFVLMTIANDVEQEKESDAAADAARDVMTRWIRSRLASTVERCNTSLESANFADFTQAAQDFVVNDLCDVYIETSKLRPDPDALVSSLDASLRLLHPVAPFCTEELWHRLHAQVSPGFDTTTSITETRYPSADELAGLRDSTVEEKVGLIIDAVHATRALRDKLKGVVESSKLFREICFVLEETHEDCFLAQAAGQRLVQHLTRAANVRVETASSSPSSNASSLEMVVQSGVVARLEVEVEAGDADKIAKEVGRLAKKAEKISKTLDKWQSRRESPRYAKAPAHVQEQDAGTILKLENERQTLLNAKDALESMIRRT
ncbi:Valine--tRNA ligase, partial [Hondaea fermentalgiana]